MTDIGSLLENVHLHLGNLMRTIVLFILSAAVALAQSDDKLAAERKMAAEFVKQLGHARYTVREAAARQLLEMGPIAVTALEEGAKSTDEEVRNRSTALLPQARMAEWKRRSAAYLADKDAKQKHDLPLLPQWEKLFDKPDAASRKLFADMVRTSGEFLKAAESNANAGKALTERSKVLLDQVRGPKGQVNAELGEVAAVLFVEIVVLGRGNSPKGAFRDYQSSPAHLLSNPIVAEAIGAHDTGPVVRNLLLKWTQAQTGFDYIGFQRFATLVQKKPFPEAVPYLAKCAKDKNSDVLSMRLLAIQALGKIGGKEAAAVLTDLITDSSSLFGGGGGGQDYRLGDSALALSIKMAGKKLSDYSLNHGGGIGFSTGDDNEIISLDLYSFPNAEAREKAIKKWKEETAGKKDSKDGKDGKEKK